METFIIYSISNSESAYIGSTRDLKSRLATHRSCRNGTSSKSLIESGNYTVKVIREFKCKFSSTRYLLEQWYIDNTPNCVNYARALQPRNLKHYQKIKRRDFYKNNTKYRKLKQWQSLEYHQENRAYHNKIMLDRYYWRRSMGFGNNSNCLVDISI